MLGAFDGSLGGRSALPIYANYGTLPSTGINLGSEALVPRLVGTGHFRVRYNGTRWVVVPGEMIAAQNDPFSVVIPGSTTPVTSAVLFSIPANLIGDGEEYEFCYPHETGANSGSDNSHLLVGGEVLYVGLASNLRNQNIARFFRNGNNLKLASFMSTGLNTEILSYSRTFSSAIDVQLKITPGANNNSSYIRRIGVRRVS